MRSHRLCKSTVFATPSCDLQANIAGWNAASPELSLLPPSHPNAVIPKFAFEKNTAPYVPKVACGTSSVVTCTKP